MNMYGQLPITTRADDIHYFSTDLSLIFRSPLVPPQAPEQKTISIHLCSYEVRPALNLQGFPTDYQRMRGEENPAGLALVAPRTHMFTQHYFIYFNIFHSQQEDVQQWQYKKIEIRFKPKNSRFELSKKNSRFE